jgi:hypothetical protein
MNSTRSTSHASRLGGGICIGGFSSSPPAYRPTKRRSESGDSTSVHAKLRLSNNILGLHTRKLCCGCNRTNPVALHHVRTEAALAVVRRQLAGGPTGRAGARPEASTSKVVGGSFQGCWACCREMVRCQFAHLGRKPSRHRASPMMPKPFNHPCVFFPAKRSVEQTDSCNRKSYRVDGQHGGGKAPNHGFWNTEQE